MPKSLVKKLFLKIFLLSLPFILILAYPLCVIILANEQVTIDWVVARSSVPDADFLYGAAYTSNLQYYKWQNTLLKKPEILVLGTSRVLQFRSRFFLPVVKFYNAGHGILHLWEYEEFLKNIPKDQYPKLLIVGIDQWQFNPTWRPKKFEQRDFPYVKSNTPILDILLRNWLVIYKESFKKRIVLSTIWANYLGVHNIGLSAAMEGRGYRQDGSYNDGNLPYRDQKVRFGPSLKSVEAGIDPFNYGQTIDLTRVDLVASFLAYCKQNNIHVIGFLPPFSQGILGAMKQNNPNYAYITEITPIIAPLFQQYGFTFMDFTNPRDLGVTSDNEMLDGYHGSEKIYLRIMIKLASADVKLRQYIDLPYLQRLLANTSDPIYLFGGR